MAEFMMKDLLRKKGLENEFRIESAAVSAEETGNDMYPDAKAILKEHDIPFEKRRARKVRSEDGEIYDCIFVMDESNLRNIHRILFRPKAKVQKLLRNRNVADPWYTGDFEKAYSDIDEGIRSRLDEILAEDEH